MGDRETVLSRLAVMTSREPPGALLSIAELREFVGGALDKERFDRAVMELSRRGVVTIHHHDYPYLLRKQGRIDDAVRGVHDGEVTYYVGIVLRGR